MLHVLNTRTHAVSISPGFIDGRELSTLYHLQFLLITNN